jgi:hypothetical protein
MVNSNPDILWGVEAIAGYIGKNVRQTYSLLQHGMIPAMKVGTQWVSRRSKLDTRLSGDEEVSR